MPDTKTLTIEALNRDGEGIAHPKRDARARPVAVPFTLPGERVSTDPLVLQTSSDERVTPVCRHFGAGASPGPCGNCALQHWAREPMLAWKRALVVEAFEQAGLAPSVGETVGVPLHSRRRVAFSLVADDRGGRRRFSPAFHKRRSHDVFALRECPILVPAIEQAFDAIGRLAGAFHGRVHKVHVTACENGLDVQLVADRAPGADARNALMNVLRADAPTIVRLSVGDETIMMREPPFVPLGGVPVTPPPGAFLQATAESERAMVDLVTAHLAGARRVADLFGGCGTFALALGGTVHAVDDAGAALDALSRAAAASGRDAVTTERRDLFERPLTAKELERFDAVVLDPPRAGAEAQVAELARTAITRVAYVSCNPRTLARDARVLVDAGWSLAAVTPIDQFLYSPHVEAVALFERAKARRRRPLFG